MTTSHMVYSLLTLSIRCLTVAVACCGPAVAGATDVPWTTGTVIRFAEVRDGVEVLTQRDDYIKQMSPFDRQVRLKTDREVTEQELLTFFSRHVLPWNADEIAKLTPLVEALGRKLAPWKLPLPPVILLVKTSGHEEGGAPYCRGAAIVLPQPLIDGNLKTLNNILPHELFHVLSSHNPRLREALYQIIGFKPCNEVLLPDPLAARKITNPDAPVNRHFITVTQDGRSLELMPVLFSKTPRYDTTRGGNLFTYLEFKLMALENNHGVRRAAIVAGQPVLLDPAGVPGYGEQIGRNTKYIIHPEEILADNFVFLIEGRIDLPSPHVIEALGQVLQAATPN